MALLKILWFLLGITFTIVNGEFLKFDGQCPEPESTEDIKNANGYYYAIADTRSEATKSDVTIELERQEDNYSIHAIDKFRTDDENCTEFRALLIQEDDMYFNVAGTDDDGTGSFGPPETRIYFLTDSITFLCYNSTEEDEDDAYYAKVVVLRKELEEFGDDQKKEVEDVLASNNLDFMNEYLSEITQDDACPVEEK